MVPLVRMTKTEDETLRRLSVIMRIVSLSLVRNMTTREEQVEVLNVAGLSGREISELLGIKYGTVAQILYKLRQTHARKRGRLARETRS